MVDVKSVIASALANQNGNFDFSAALPGVKSSVGWYSPDGLPPDITGTALTGAELAGFAQWYYNTFGIYTSFGPQRAFFEDKFAAALWALYAAKKSITGTYGAGVQGSLHAQSIRPESLASFFTTPPAVVRDWTQSVSAGWTQKFFNFNNNNSSTTALLNTQNNIAMIVLALAEQNSVPGLQGLQFYDSGAKPYGVETTSLISQADEFNTYGLPNVVYVDKNKTAHIDIEFISTRSETLQPIGIQFVTSEYYVLE